MANLKEIRVRIASVQSTQKITSAMKLVSAAKLRRAQNAISTLRLYSNKLNAILQNLSLNISEDYPLFAQREPENVALIAITSNRGLCGAFNANIIKATDRLIKEKYATQHQNGKLKLICFGKKATEQLQKNYNIAYANESLLDVPNFDEIAAIVSDLITDFNLKKIDKIEIVYNRFVNPATQKVTVEGFLPVMNMEKGRKGEKEKGEKAKEGFDFILEPSPSELVNVLIPKILKTQLYKTILDSIAAEHGARMTSMAKATDNASEILKELKLKYNNARQAVITNELNEIESGAEALKN
jgi:F-type H+-transporting ATPase subunit gamma